eukprot:scaffold26728_cov33-Tisochrysis_lutea.AAC.2
MRQCPVPFSANATDEDRHSIGGLVSVWRTALDSTRSTSTMRHALSRTHRAREISWRGRACGAACPQSQATCEGTTLGSAGT